MSWWWDFLAVWARERARGWAGGRAGGCVGQSVSQ